MIIMKKHWLVAAAPMLTAQLCASTAHARDTNTQEVIRELQKRIGELEQKVKVLEAGKKADGQGTDAQAKERIHLAF